MKSLRTKIMILSETANLRIVQQHYNALFWDCSGIGIREYLVTMYYYYFFFIYSIVFESGKPFSTCSLISKSEFEKAEKCQGKCALRVPSAYLRVNNRGPTRAK